MDFSYKLALHQNIRQAITPLECTISILDPYLTIVTNRLYFMHGTVLKLS